MIKLSARIQGGTCRVRVAGTDACTIEVGPDGRWTAQGEGLAPAPLHVVLAELDRRARFGRTSESTQEIIDRIVDQTTKMVSMGTPRETITYNVITQVGDSPAVKGLGKVMLIGLIERALDKIKY